MLEVTEACRHRLMGSGAMFLALRHMEYIQRCRALPSQLAIALNSNFHHGLLLDTMCAPFRNLRPHSYPRNRTSPTYTRQGLLLHASTWLPVYAARHNPPYSYYICVYPRSPPQHPSNSILPASLPHDRQPWESDCRCDYGLCAYDPHERSIYILSHCL